MSKKECCKECRFSVGVDVFNCVRFPPVVFPMQAQNHLTQEVTMQAVALPVQVTSDYWCGEYKERMEGLKLVDS